MNYDGKFKRLETKKKEHWNARPFSSSMPPPVSVARQPQNWGPPQSKALPRSALIPSNAIRFCIPAPQCSLLLRKTRCVFKLFPVVAAQRSAQVPFSLCQFPSLPAKIACLCYTLFLARLLELMFHSSWLLMSIDSVCC